MWGSAAALLVIVTLVCRSVPFWPLSPLQQTFAQGAVLLGALSAGGALVLLRRRPTERAHAVVAVTSCVLATVLSVNLTHTPFGLDGLDRDQAFRTASMTRFALSAVPADFGYPDLGPFYPPLWFWTSGRLAVLLGIPGWEMMKWAQIGTAFLVPLLGYLVWRRVLPAGPAAAAAVLGTLVAAIPPKGDEWLALVLMVPWWLDAFADVQATDRRRLPAWWHGFAAGMLLSLHTAFFIPAAMATVILLVLRSRQGRLGEVLRRGSVLVLVGLLVWCWVWVPMLLERLAGAASENRQFFWLGGDADVPDPITLTPAGLVMLCGLVGSVWFARRRPLAEAQTVFLAGTGVAVTVGVLMTGIGRPILVHKIYPMVDYAMVSAAVAATVLVLQRIRAVALRRRVSILATVLAVAAATTFALDTVTEQLSADELERAYRTAAPNGIAAAQSLEEDGLGPSGGDATTTGEQTPPSPRAVPPQQVAELVRRAVPRDELPVVLSTRYDVYAFYGFYNFLQVNDFYSHPHAHYSDRLALLGELSTVREPQTMHTRLTTNRFDPVDALVLDVTQDGYGWTYRRNAFPDPTQPVTITLSPQAFQDPDLFSLTRVGDQVVVVPR